MTDIKKTLKTAGIWCIVASLLCIGSLFTNMYIFELSLYFIICNVIEIILSITTTIIFFYYSRKTKEEILKKRSLFYTLSIINIFNNFIVWVLCFWVQLTLNKEVRTESIKQFFDNPNNDYKTHNQQDEDLADIIIEEDNYTTKNSVETLTSRLEELKKLRKKNLISEEEYERFRQEALKKFMS